MTTRQGRRGLRISGGGGDERRPVVITGGAGFIGTNVAHRYLRAGQPVLVLDNLSRPGVEQNLRWLQDVHGSLLHVDVADVRDRAAVRRAVTGARQVVHLAAQVAVTTSVVDPVLDFEVNALGTLNVLNAIREQDDPPPLLFTSTNKVYGALDDILLETDGRRYSPAEERLRESGIDETRPLDFHSPYGCSKGAADQYVLDYTRTYDVPAVVFRMSCIYGPHQFGTEDQGWVAHFLIRALRGEPITLYGDGQQVRDVLFIDDLVDAIELAFDRMDVVSGRAYNMGGGPANTTSLVELVELIGELAGASPQLRFGTWRPGDQRYYVSDPSFFSTLTGWSPRRGVADGLRALHAWLLEMGVPARAGVQRPVPAWEHAAAAAAGER